MCHTGWIYISAARTTYETDKQRTWTLDIECPYYKIKSVLLGCSFLSLTFQWSIFIQSLQPTTFKKLWKRNPHLPNKILYCAIFFH